MFAIIILNLKMKNQGQNALNWAESQDNRSVKLKLPQPTGTYITQNIPPIDSSGIRPVALLKHNLDQVNPVYNSSITFQYPRVKMQPHDEIDYPGLCPAQLWLPPPTFLFWTQTESHLIFLLLMISLLPCNLSLANWHVSTHQDSSALFSGKIPWLLSSSQAVHALSPWCTLNVSHHGVYTTDCNLQFILATSSGSTLKTETMSPLYPQHLNIALVSWSWVSWIQHENKYLEPKYGERLMPEPMKLCFARWLIIINREILSWRRHVDGIILGVSLGGVRSEFHHSHTLPTNNVPSKHPSHSSTHSIWAYQSH